MQPNDLPMNLTPPGKAKSYSGDGITILHESSKETDEHNDHVALRDSQKKNPHGIRVSRIAGNDMRR